MKDTLFLRLFRWVIFCVCFIAFPLALLNYGLHMGLARHWEAYTNSEARRVTMRMEQILRASKDREFYYELIDRCASHLAASADRPLLQKRLAQHFMKRFDGLIDLYITNPKGEMVFPDDLPPGVSRFAVRKLHEGFAELPSIRGLLRNLKILWYFLSDNPSNEDFPQMDVTRRMAEIYPMGRRSLLYGRIFPQGGVFGQVHKGAREAWFPVTLLAEKSNQKGQAMTLGLYSRERVSSETPLKANEVSVVTQGLAAIDHSARDWFVRDHLLVRVMTLDSNNKFWGLVRLDQQREGRLWKSRALVYSILLFFSIAIVSFCLLVLDWRIWFSIRWKLIGLFGIATGLPLVVLFVKGYDLLQSTEQNLKAEALTNLQESVKSLDLKFPQITRDYVALFGRLQKSITKPNDRQQLLAFFDELVRRREELGYNMPLILQRDGTIIVRDDRDRKNVDRFLMALGMELMTRFNKAMGFKEEAEVQTARSVEAAMLSDKNAVGLVHGLFKNMGQLARMSFGRSDRFLYLSVFQDDRGMAHSIYFMSIPSKRIFHSYLQKYLLVRQREVPNSRLFAFHEDDANLHVPKAIHRESWLVNFVDRVRSRRGVVADELEIEGQPCMAVGIPGSQVDQYCLVQVLPLTELVAAKQQLSVQLLLFGVLCLALSMSVGFMLSGQFLRPIAALADGVQAINEGRFQHRVDRLSDDELGQLSNSFNVTMERLEELSVAHTVQESLFPATKLELGGMEVFGQSIAATELGGDYYDYFSVDDKRLVILIGDVAGHGTASALLMAMAKATITVEVRNNPHPAHMLEVVNQMIFTAMRKKRMMTFFYALVDTSTGEIEYVNAGHNSPFLLRVRDGQFLELASESYPLGTRKTMVYKQRKIDLAPGDSLWCYTDGFPECACEGRDQLGYDLFRQVLRESRGADAFERCQAVYRRINAMRGMVPQNDDMTMILLQHRGASAR
ncbi:MAG TPA: SpoIIE family protein phosphatase [Candidatus Ozemobacteraceae bacterium]|nr:SpoIIE family protein phosphatase [Candidatus Ozemobacteraceae bacterium]